MEVDFSQIGQNIALQDVVTATSVKLNEQTEAKAEQSSHQQETKEGQERQNIADIKESSFNDSINIESAVTEISDFLQATNRQLSFSIDDRSDRAIVKVTDSVSGEVIRQIPSEEVLALSEKIKELQSDVGSAVGVLFNKQV